MDLTKLSDSDLEALRSGNLKMVSDRGLALLQGESAPGPKTPAPEPATEPAMGRGEQFMTAVGGGMVGLGLGARQLGAEVGQRLGLVRPQTVQELRQEGAAHRDVMNRLKAERGGTPGIGNLASWGEFVGETAPLMAIPVGSAGAAGRVLPRVAAGAATGGLTGAVMPRTPEESRRQAAIEGAVIGGALPAAAAAGRKFYDWAFNQGPVRDVISRGLARAGIKPTGAKTAGQRKEFYDTGVSAVKDIVENKGNLVLDGERGRLPQTVAEFSEAVDQTKRKVFSEYDALLQEAQAEGGGGLLSTSNVVNRLNEIEADKAFAVHGDKSARFLLDELRAAYTENPNLTLTEAQNFIASLNQKLAAFEKNPNMDTVSTAYINDQIARVLRQELDDTITALKGPGYASLKKRYGALKNLEEKVAKSATKTEGKKSLTEELFGDRYSGVKMAYGAVTGKAPAIIAGGAVKGLSMYQKHVAHPDTVIRKMFSNVERASSQFGGPRRVPPAVGGRVPRAAASVATSPKGELPDQLPAWESEDDWRKAGE